MKKVKLIPDLIPFEVDESMLGSEWDSERWSLEDFCETLQAVLNEQCYFFEVIPIKDSWNGADNHYDDPTYSIWRIDHGLGDSRFDAYDCADQWEEAIERYFTNWESSLLKSIKDEDLTELPDGLRDAIITKRDHPENFTTKMYHNIYHNLLRKSAHHFAKIGKKYEQKAKTARIFQKIYIKEIDKIVLKKFPPSLK